MRKIGLILLNALPIIVMIGLISLIANDYLLTVLDIVVIGISFAFKREKDEWLILIAGFIIMIISEYLFVSTGVETFKRNTLFGLMPLWLPFLWAYGFVAIKRCVQIIEG
jgi:hypothetical protein